MERVVTIIMPYTTALGEKILGAINTLGRWCLFVGEIFAWSVRPPFRVKQLFQQLEFVGVKSVGLISLTAFFTGGVFALQSGKVYALFHMEVMVGATVGMSLTREMAPVFAALMVTARACSAMAAELGSMQVTEQIDALKTMAVDPIHYLVVPRVWATTIMVPFLTMLFNVVGVLGAYVVGVFLLMIPPGSFMARLYYYVDVDDIFGGLMKAAIFGFVISAVSCFQGFFTSGGASGVGRATTRSVVVSAVTILVLDYFLTTWILEYITH